MLRHLATRLAWAALAWFAATAAIRACSESPAAVGVWLAVMLVAIGQAVRW